MLDDVALDRYTFTRDAYLQRRRNDIFDGNPPEDEATPAQ
jgi:phospholipid-binding lipoprotein MlaA